MSTQCTTPNCVEVTNSLLLRKSAVQSTGLNGRTNRLLALTQRWLNGIKGFVVTRYEQRLDRLAFQQMLTLDEHMLKDIGITRGDVIYANNLPLTEDAAKVVEAIARRH